MARRYSSDRSLLTSLLLLALQVRKLGARRDWQLRSFVHLECDNCFYWLTGYTFE